MKTHQLIDLRFLVESGVNALYVLNSGLIGVMSLPIKPSL